MVRALISLATTLAGAAIVYKSLFYGWLLSPFASFPYDWEPSDGDMAGVVLRILTSKPIYEDWRLGNIVIPYMPLYNYVLALGHELTGIDAALLGRTMNIALLMSWAALVFTLSYVCTRGLERTDRIISGVFAAHLAFLPSAQILPYVPYLRPDSLVVPLLLVGTLLLIARPDRPSWIATIAVLAALTKQTAVGLGIAATLYYIIFDRGRLKSFVIIAGSVAVALIAPLEILNEGRFLRSTLWYAGRMFSDSLLSWEYLISIVQSYAAGKNWVLPFLISSIVAAIARPSPLRPLLLVATVETLLQLRTARNIGGNAYYLWFLWLLLSVVAATGLTHGTRWVVSMWKTQKGSWRRLAAPALVLAIVTWITVDDSRAFYRQRPPDLSHASAISQRHEDLLKSIIAEQPTARWAADRSAMSLARLGKTIDQEGSTTDMVLRHSSLFDREVLVKRFEAGEYDLFQTGCCLSEELLKDTLAKCFSQIAESEVVFLTEIRKIKILKYEPGPLCGQQVESPHTSSRSSRY